MKNKNSVIICGFPGIGKSWIKFNSILSCLQGSVFSITDSDSSKWGKDRFPDNYINYISGNHKANPVNLLMLSTHKEVIKGLVEKGLNPTIVYPDRSLKDEYLDRYRNRSNKAAFVEILNSKWDDFIDDIESFSCPKIKLNTDEYLVDVLVFDDKKGVSLLKDRVI